MNPKIDCASNPCDHCNRAGRTSWRSRVQWHTEKLRKRARLRRFALRAVVPALAAGVLMASAVLWMGWLS